jgi:hypothetical protein
VVKVSEIKRINNSICGYRDCKRTSNVRLFFALGFSARFCDDCSEILLRDGLARKLDDNLSESANILEQGLLDY